MKKNYTTTMAKRKIGETEEQKQRRLYQQRERARRKRSLETNEQRKIRLSKNKDTTAAKRSQETEEQRQLRLIKDRARAAVKRLHETEEQRQHRLNEDKKRTAARRLQETEEQRQLRLNQGRERIDRIRTFNRFDAYGSFFLPLSDYKYVQPAQLVGPMSTMHSALHFKDMSNTSQTEVQDKIGDEEINACGSPINGSSDAESSGEASGKQESDGPLPFESLAVELEEDDGNSAMVDDNEETNDNSCLPEADASCTDSNVDMVYDEESHSELPMPADSEENSKLLNPAEMMEQTMSSKVDLEDTGEDSLIGYEEAPLEIDEDPTIVIKQEVMDDEAPSVPKTYIDDFIYSTGSNILPDSDSTSNDEKGLPLHRFPTIKKTVESADYETLQDLYQLLYLRNAWDTDRILVNRILDFSGFNCEPNSEDYYTREVILRTMEDKTLQSIANLLCIANLKSLSADLEKTRLVLVSKIMNFLYKPKRRRQARTRKSNSSTPKSKKAQPKSKAAEKKGGTKAEDSKPSPSTSEEASKSKKKNTRAGPLSYKKKVLSEEDMLLVENDLKKKVEEGKAVEPKVDLKRIDLSVFCQLLGENNTGLQSKDEGDTKSSDDSQSTEKEKASTDDSDKHKLKDFAQILSSIEGTPDELLMDIYFLLFLQSAEMSEMKDKILEFEGFSSEESTEKHEERKDFLQRMSEDIVKGVARAFSLNAKSDKQANITHILSFLKEPQESFLKPTVIAPGMLSDCDLDFDDMSDSDDSITCEVVPKRVECIDLISSGDESEKEAKKAKKMEPKKIVEKVIMPQEKVIMSHEPVVVPPAEPRDPNIKRSLRDFETITKIVNTHPNEYLVDIYNLLFMTPHEAITLRKDILDFGGFEFEKGTPEYVKRKQFLDRMLYNSVRRIYNTLIHNTREVKVFSKPTMIGEIFQFLFKLPDTDTSIRLPPPKAVAIRPAPIPIVTREPEKVYTPEMPTSEPPSNLPAATVFGLLNQSQKLSELKRVFQRVACFPCEYLVDVHKLLFMSDCEMKDIRANIFGFKGFSFGVDSPEFNQRKMYLEYLTFHSLRKISSVLTTKTVDLRNSTKHELASHLTQVLTEYTNTYFETEPIGSEAPTEDMNEQVWSSLSSNFLENVNVQEPTDPDVEKIVVTPIIQPMEPSPATTPEPPSEVTAAKSDDHLDLTVSSSTSGTEPQLLMKALTNAETPDVPKVTQRKKSESVYSPQPSTSGRGRGKRKRATVRQLVTPGSSKSEQMANLQFPDIYLPEVEKYKQIYNQNVNILPKTLEGPHNTGFNPAMMQSFSPNYMVEQQQNFGPPPFAHFGPNQAMQYPIMQAFPPHLPVQNQVFAVHATAPIRPNMDPTYQDNKEEDFEKHISPVECILTEDVESIPSKRSKVVKLSKSDKQTGAADGSKKITESTQEKGLAEKSDDKSLPSFQMKIRDAMTKASEDEEDCDKPLSTLVGHPNDKLLKQQICDIVEQTDLKDITMNGVIQKVFSMHPQYNLNYRKDFIKSILRSLLYRLGEQDGSKSSKRTSDSVAACSPDCSVSTTDPRDSPLHSVSPPVEPIPDENWKSFPSPTFHHSQKS